MADQEPQIDLELRSYPASDFDVEAWLERLRAVPYPIDKIRENTEDSSILCHPERQTGDKIFVIDLSSDALLARIS